MRVFVRIATLFVIGSLLGYGIEVLYRRFVSQKKWVNPGFMVGPYIPLYGFGTLILFSLSQLNFTSYGVSEAWSNVIIVLIIGAAMTLIELIAGLIFIKGLHLKLWDYSKRKWNYKGIICPLFSLIWFLVGVGYFYLLNPWFVKAIKFFDDNVIYTFFIGLVIGMMIVDFAYSLHLGIILRKATGDALIRYESFKKETKENYKKRLGKSKFFGSIISQAKSTEELKEMLAKHLEEIKKKRKKKKQSKDE